MKEYVKSELRQLVLEHRIHLREARTRMEDAAKEYSTSMQAYETWRERIADLQTACGDPIEIDPTYPDPPKQPDFKRNLP